MDDPLQSVRCLRGDITTQAVDAIVNAANTALRGGGGVDGAIHRAAGPALLAELEERYPRGSRTGEVCPTGAGDLPARFVLHAVGPRWRGGGAGEPEALASCYAESVRLAREAGLRSIAFPAISTGIYGYPAERAAEVAFAALAASLPGSGLEDVRLVLFSEELLAVFAAALGRARAG